MNHKVRQFWQMDHNGKTTFWRIVGYDIYDAPEGRGYGSENTNRVWIE